MGRAGLMIKSDFPRLSHPARMAAALRARRRARITAIRAVDPGQWGLRGSRIQG